MKTDMNIEGMSLVDLKALSFDITQETMHLTDLGRKVIARIVAMQMQEKAAKAKQSEALEELSDVINTEQNQG